VLARNYTGKRPCARRKIEGYDPINEMLFRDNPALGVWYALFVLSVMFALLAIFDPAQGEHGVLAEEPSAASTITRLSFRLNIS
jgi:hypothetical protein